MKTLNNLLLEIETEQELEQEIESYVTLDDKIKIKQAQIQSVLDEIESMSSENTKRFREIDKHMKRFNIENKTVKSWVAKMSEKLKYKVVRPDFKKLWLEALTKVNQATKNVMLSLENTQLELKRKETIKVLSIKQEGVFDSLKSLWNKFKTLISSFKSFSKIANKLPKI